MPLTISKEQFENVLRNVSSIYPLQCVGAGVGLGAAAGLNLQVINTQQQYDEATMANEIQKIDSVHDFGSTRGNNLATDNITKVKAVVNSNVVYYSYNQMTLSFIQKYSFHNVPEIGVHQSKIFPYSCFQILAILALLHYNVR